MKRVPIHRRGAVTSKAKYRQILRKPVLVALGPALTPEEVEQIRRKIINGVKAMQEGK